MSSELLTHASDPTAPADEASQEFSVTFQPPLFLQRRGWAFDIMRRERVRQVLDVGCGEGELLGCLCNPAPWLAPLPPSSESTTDEEEPHDVSEPLADGYIRPFSLHALEPDPTLVDTAAQATAPPPPRGEVETAEGRLGGWLESVRWNELEVKVWKGGLEVENEEMVGVECIVATEVYVSNSSLRSGAAL